VPLLHDNIFAPFEALPSQMTTKCRTAFALAMSWATRVRQAALARHVWAAPATRHLQSIALLSLPHRFHTGRVTDRTSLHILRFHAP
jgi:hypothetical protein